MLRCVVRCVHYHVGGGEGVVEGRWERERERKRRFIFINKIIFISKFQTIFFLSCNPNLSKRRTKENLTKEKKKKRKDFKF